MEDYTVIYREPNISVIEIKKNYWKNPSHGIDLKKWQKITSVTKRKRDVA